MYDPIRSNQLPILPLLHFRQLTFVSVEFIQWHVLVLLPIPGKELAIDLGNRYYHYRLGN